MNISVITAPTVAERFARWANLELAAHFAAGCPDETMNQIVADVATAMEDLAATPASSASDMALKLYPLVLYAYEPPLGADPLIAAQDHGQHCDRGLVESFLADLDKHHPDLAALVRTPCRRKAA